MAHNLNFFFPSPATSFLCGTSPGSASSPSPPSSTPFTSSASSSPEPPSSGTSSPLNTPSSTAPARSAPRRGRSGTGHTSSGAGHTKRPPNAFILFRKFMNSWMHGIERDPSQISVIAGKAWRSLPPHEQDKWYDEAARRKSKHKLEHPDYKFRPVRGKQKQKRNVPKNQPKLRRRAEKVGELWARGVKGRELVQQARMLDQAAKDVPIPDAYTTAVFHVELPDYDGVLCAPPAPPDARDVPVFADLLLPPADPPAAPCPPSPFAASWPGPELPQAPAPGAYARAPSAPLLAPVPLPACAPATHEIDFASWDVHALDAFLLDGTLPEPPQWAPAQGSVLEPQPGGAQWQGAYAPEDPFGLALGLALADAPAPDPAMDVDMPLEFGGVDVLQWPFAGT